MLHQNKCERRVLIVQDLMVVYFYQVSMVGQNNI